ncbi:MAG: hypothetical protein ACTHXB_07235 [Luteimonas sp.]
MRTPYESAPTGQGRGAGIQTNGHGLSLHTAEIIERLQFRLSANACAIDALTPDLDYCMRVVWLVAKGMPLPGDAPQRLNRLALRLIDARHVLEAELPPEVRDVA